MARAGSKLKESRGNGQGNQFKRDSMFRRHGPLPGHQLALDRRGVKVVFQEIIDADALLIEEVGHEEVISKIESRTNWVELRIAGAHSAQLVRDRKRPAFGDVITISLVLPYGKSHVAKRSHVISDQGVSNF